MVVETRRFVPNPPYPEGTGPKPFPASEEEVIELIPTTKAGAYTRISIRISRMVVQIAKPIRWHLAKSEILFQLSDSEDGYIPPSSLETPHPGYALERGKLQEMGMTAMEDFGLNQDIYRTTYTYHGENGVFREVRDYPSQTVNGLVFNRLYDKVEASENPVFVEWSIRDEAGLPFNLARGRVKAK